MLSDCSDGMVQTVNYDMVDLRIRKNEVRGKQRYRQRSSNLPVYNKVDRLGKRKLKVFKPEDISFRMEPGTYGILGSNAFSPLVKGDSKIFDQ